MPEVIFYPDKKIMLLGKIENRFLILLLLRYKSIIRLLVNKKCCVFWFDSSDVRTGDRQKTEEKKTCSVSLTACVILSAGAMLIFSVSFQIDQMSRRTERIYLINYIYYYLQDTATLHSLSHLAIR